MDSEVNTAYLSKFGFTQLNLEKMTVKDVIQNFDTKNNHFVIATDGHLFYVYDSTIFDDVDEEYRGEVYDCEVICVMYKPTEQLNRYPFDIHPPIMICSECGETKEIELFDHVRQKAYCKDCLKFKKETRYNGTKNT